MINENILTDQEAKFCLLYVNGSHSGNAKRCYQDVFNEFDDATAKAEARKLLSREVVKKRIKELSNVELYTAESLRPHITETLVSIMDECAKDTYEDKNGLVQQPAAMRAVAVHAAKTLNDMYGIKEDIAHNINLNSEGDVGSGVVVNIVVPKKRETNEEDLLNED